MPAIEKCYPDIFTLMNCAYQSMILLEKFIDNLLSKEGHDWFTNISFFRQNVSIVFIILRTCIN
jgi:hypothetical protein